MLSHSVQRILLAARQCHPGAGLGNPIGALIATSALIMIQNVWSVCMQPSWSPLIAFSLFILYLIVQPDVLWRQWRARRRMRHPKV